MKKILLVFGLCTLVSRMPAFSQEVIRIQPCHDSLMQKQADSIKLALSKTGFELLKENLVSMESEYELPVIVPLQQRSLYEFVFIGDASSKLYEVYLLDWNQVPLVQLKQKTEEPSRNIIAFTHIPEYSEHYIFKAVQVNKKKKKGLCGYVMLFKKTKA